MSVILFGSRSVEPARAAVTVGAGPFSQQAELPGYEPGPGFGQGPGAVALSANGNTAIIGDPDKSAWIFVRSGSTWAEQTRFPFDTEPNDGYGSSVAISADGNTALVGGAQQGLHGEASLFVRSGSAWTQQASWGPTSLGPAESPAFGASVALSADGSTALVGDPDTGPENQEGAARAFTRSEGKWSEFGQVLRGAGEITEPYGPRFRAHFGDTVALSADANVAFIAAPGDHELRGAVWAFERSSSGWIERGKLTPSDEVGTQEFGTSIALSAHGDTALIGGGGAAWIFVRSGQSWVQQGARLTNASDPTESTAQFGGSLAMSADANTALFGAENFGENHNGTAWVFRRSGTSFSQVQQFVGSTQVPNVSLGSSVAISADGTTALISAPHEWTVMPAGGGAAYVFVAPSWTPLPAGSGPGGPPTPALAGTPMITRFSQSHRRWRVAPPAKTHSHARGGAPVGTTFSFTLNEPARVTFVFAQVLTGKTAERRCRKLRQQRHCPVLLPRGVLQLAAHAGANKVVFSGRFRRGAALPAGSYNVGIRAIDAAGRRSPPARLSFTVVA